MKRSRALTQRDFLHCEGRKIVNAADEPVALKGTNLGGWLIAEAWMSSIRGFEAQWDIDTTLEKRFGRDEARRLLGLYQDNYITEYDLDLLADRGFNCLRVPFWYRNLQSDDDGTFIRKSDGSIDFGRLDWVVSQCQRRGVYVILDMHGAPGFQSIAHHSGRVNHCRLYDSTPEGEKMRALSCELWREIAAHFRTNPAVAGYDLLNEPMCDYKGRQKVNRAYHAVYDVLYNAVREADGDHIVFIEGIWTPFDLPRPQKRWENAVYEYHLYLPGNACFKAFPTVERLRFFKNPVYIGEFSPCRGSAKWKDILDVFNRHGWSWTTWTYKGHCDGDSSDWFMYGTSGHGFDLDIRTAGIREIERRFGEELQTQKSFKPMARF